MSAAARYPCASNRPKTQGLAPIPTGRLPPFPLATSRVTRNPFDTSPDSSFTALCDLSSNIVQLKGYAYAYSDMTGVQTRLATNTSGWYQRAFQGCAGKGETQWKLLDWDVDVPEGTAVLFYVRSASTREGLEAASWRPVTCISTPRHPASGVFT